MCLNRKSKDGEGIKRRLIKYAGFEHLQEIIFEESKISNSGIKNKSRRCPTLHPD